VNGLKHQKEKRSMDHFAGLDVSVKETSICIVDETGKIVREVKVASEPEALLAVLACPAYHFKRIGLEAGPLSQWLYGALAEAGLPVICVETRHMRAVLKAQINKTDRNDARGVAQMMRVGLYRPVHVKTLRSQKLRMQLTHRASRSLSRTSPTWQSWSSRCWLSGGCFASSPASCIAACWLSSGMMMCVGA
jgi:transposase